MPGIAPPPMPIEDQVRLLQKFGNPDFQQRCALVLAALCLGLLGIAWVQREFFFAFLALMFVVIGLSGRRQLRFADLAAKAWRTGTTASGTLELTVKTDGEDTSYSGVVRDAQQRSWQMRFGKPPGWEPEGGQIAVKLYSVSAVPWPVLILTAHGLLLPNAEPKPLQANMKKF